MNKSLILLLVLFLQFAAKAQQREHYVRLGTTSREELKELSQIVSIDKRRGDTVFAYCNARQMEELKQSRFAFQVILHPGRHLNNPDMALAPEEMAEWNRYPAYGVYADMMQTYASDFPAICQLDTIGFSHENRALLALRISDQARKQEDEPAFFYTSTMHGDETLGYVLLLRLIDTLLHSYGTDPHLTGLIDSMAITINPNANPDGTYASGNQSISGATRGNAAGIDLNRNFPDPENGQHPDGNPWQPETRAMMEYTRKHNFNLSANLHTGAEVVNYPWDTWAHDHPDTDWWEAFSHVYADAVQANGPAGYFTGIAPSGITNGYDWYSIYGGRQDFMTYFRQGREVTLELSSTKMPAGDTLPAFWQYNKTALISLMEQALTGIHGVVSSNSGEPLLAEVRVLNHDTNSDSSMVFTHPHTGSYYRYLAPGTYSLAFKAANYMPDTLHDVQIGAGHSVRKDVSLQRNAVFVDQKTAEEIDFGLYPNPAADKLHIQTRSNGRLVLLSLSGEILAQWKLSQNPETILSLPKNLQAGLYLLQWITDKGKCTKRLVIKK